MNITLRTLTLTAVIAAGAITLSACTPTTAPTPTSTAVETPDTQATPAPVETEPTLEVGATVDAAAAEELNAAKGDTRAYELPDGTFVIVDKGAPLPKPVVDAIATDVKETATSTDAGYTAEAAAAGSAAANRTAIIISKARKATGKNVVIVNRVATSNAGGSNFVAWAALSSTGQFLTLDEPILGDSAEPVVVRAQAVIDKTKNPAEWEIIVIR